MGSAWLGLLGAVVGGLVTLTGTVVTSRFQWRQEKARWSAERARDLEQRESERLRETRAWERDRGEERTRWRRDQRHTSCMEVMDHLLAASELTSSTPRRNDVDLYPYADTDQLAIARELRQAYRGMKSLNVVCGEEATAKLRELSSELYFTIQVLTHEGMRQGKMVRRPEGKRPEEWLLMELIDTMAAKTSDVVRADLASD